MPNTLSDIALKIGQAVQDGSVAVVFDLDSTLFCVSPRTQAILRDLSKDEGFQQEHPDVAKILATIEVQPTDWGVRTVLERESVTGTVPLWNAIRNFWREHFFANHYLHEDVVYSGSLEYVQSLKSLGAEILYLTGRSHQTMREGTVKMLRQCGFPLDSEDRLLMKPSDVETDEAFKALVLKDLLDSYKQIWFFENEPVIIEHVRVHAPRVQIVYVNSVNSGRKSAPTDLPRIGMNYLNHIKKL